MPVDGRWPTADVELLLDEPRRLVETVAESGLAISAFSNHWDSQLVLGPYSEDTDSLFAGSTKEKQQHGIRRTLLAGDLAAATGVGLVCGFVGCPDFSRWFPWPTPDGWERMENAFADQWGPIMDHFAGKHTRFAHECHPKQMAYNTETALRAVELMRGSPAWGYNLDPANLLIAGADPIVFAADLHERVWNVHAKDHETVAHNVARSGTMAHGDWGRPDRGYRFRIPGWGDVPWKRLFTELHLRGFSGYVAVEHEDPTIGLDEGIAKALQFLEPLMLETTPEEQWW